MNIDLKKRILAFNDLGTLFQENFIDKNDKTFPEWNSILDIKLKEAKSFNSWFTNENLKLSLNNWSNQLKKRNLKNWISSYNINNDNNKTIAIIILSVTFFGVLFFILVRNVLKKKLEILVEEEKKRKSDNLD